MSTEKRDLQIHFAGMSIAGQLTQSVAMQNYGGFSMTNFTNLYALNPQIATTAETARVLGTLIQCLFRQP